MLQYYVLNSSPHLLALLEFIRQHHLDHQVHLNRTRFWVATGSIAYTEFVLRYADHCAPVNPHSDLVTGF
jgi:hypothetical protein